MVCTIIRSFHQLERDEIMEYPKFKNAGEMLCALETEMDRGTHRFRLLMKNGDEEVVNISHFWEDDIVIADEDLEPCGWIEDEKVASFIPVK